VILYTIGDSWTYGTELENPKEECYPYLLSKKLKCDLVNEAQPAASNDWMFRKSIEWITKSDISNIHTFIVGWSHFNRREEQFQFYHGGELEDMINSRGDNNPMEKIISKNFANLRLQAIKTFTYIYTLQEILKKNNIKYIFYFPWDDVLLQDKWYDETIKSDVHDIYLRIDRDYCIGPRLGNKQITDRISPKLNSLHPNKEEHEFIAKKLQEFISLGDKRYRWEEVARRKK